MRKNINRMHLFVLAILFYAFGTSQEFESIKIRSNPAIVFKNTGDSISNRVAGYIDMKNSVLRPKYVIPEDKTTMASFWEVSPEFNTNSDLKISSNINTALSSIDSGYIFVYAGYYNEIITGKDNVTIIGVSPDRVFITTSNDSSLVYVNGKKNFIMKNLTIQSTGATSGIDKALVNLKNCYVDSLTHPKIVFDNIRIIGVNNDNIYGIKADSSRYEFKNSYIKVTNTANGNERSCIYLRKGSNPIITRSILICDNGEPADRLFIAEDMRCRLIISYSELMVTQGALMVDGSSIYWRAYQNICNEAFTGFNNLISSANNIEDANFFIR